MSVYFVHNLYMRIFQHHVIWSSLSLTVHKHRTHRGYGELSSKETSCYLCVKIAEFYIHIFISVSIKMVLFGAFPNSTLAYSLFVGNTQP